MPRGIPSKSTVKPPTIRERALEGEKVGVMVGRKEDEGKMIFIGDPPTPDQPIGPVPPISPPVTYIHEGPVPFLTIRLRRVGPIITDSLNTVSIPAPAFLKEGERVLVAIYQTEGDWQPVEPRLP